MRAANTNADEREANCIASLGWTRSLKLRAILQSTGDPCLLQAQLFELASLAQLFWAFSGANDAPYETCPNFLSTAAQILEALEIVQAQALMLLDGNAESFPLTVAPPVRNCMNGCTYQRGHRAEDPFEPSAAHEQLSKASSFYVLLRFIAFCF